MGIGTVALGDEEPSLLYLSSDDNDVDDNDIDSVGRNCSTSPQTTAIAANASYELRCTVYRTVPSISIEVIVSQSQESSIQDNDVDKDKDREDDNDDAKDNDNGLLLSVLARVMAQRAASMILFDDDYDDVRDYDGEVEVSLPGYGGEGGGAADAAPLLLRTML